MYMLAETAIGDSRDNEVLSLEEVEELKKESTFLAGRIDGTKRKLVLEMKLRDAAKSLSKLYNPGASEENDPNESSKSRRSRRSLFNRRGSTESLDKSDSELAVSTRKCEALAQELWKLESKAQEVHHRLLEHTAGVLQMTHKGLKKNAKNGAPQSPESMSGKRDSMNDFDDRSLYQQSDYLNGFNGNGPGHANDSGSIGLEAIQDTERKLEDLSMRMRDTILRSNPDQYMGPVPQSSSNGGPVNPTATVEAYLAYIANGMGALGTSSGGASTSRAVEPDSEHNLGDINSRIHEIVANSGLSRGPTLAPPPEADSGFQEHVSYLNNGVDSLQHRFEGLLEQKDILTTQIQQQRVLNSKSDAERDAHIGELVEQLAHARKEAELTEREGQATRDELDLVNQQFAAAREQFGQQNSTSRGVDDDGSTMASEERGARERAEAEVARLVAALQHLQGDGDKHAESQEARALAESEVARLEADVEQLRSQCNSQSDELSEARAWADSEIARLQSVIDNLHQEAEARAEEVTEARDRAEQQVAQMEEALQQTRNESDSRIREATSSHEQARGDVARLEGIIASHGGVDSQVKEATEAQAAAERRVLELEDTLQQIRTETDHRIREHTDSHAQAQSEVARLQAIIEQSSNDSDPQAKEATETAARLQQEFAELEGEYVRAQTELTMAKAELDGAYGSRSERAAANPTLQKEFEELNTRNIEMAMELAELKAGKPGGDGNLKRRAETLEKELRETIDDYESMTKASIEFEKEREGFEALIDRLRDRCEQLETQVNEERINWMGLNSPTSMSRDSTSETTSTMVLKNEFKRMMRDTRIENMKILKVCLPSHLLALSQPTNRYLDGTRRTSTTGEFASFAEEGAGQQQTGCQPNCCGFMMTMILRLSSVGLAFPVQKKARSMLIIPFFVYNMVDVWFSLLFWFIYYFRLSSVQIR